MNQRPAPANPTKFQFDTVFAADVARGISGSGRQRSTFAADEVETMRHEAHAAGRASALAEAAHSQAIALSAIAQSATTLIEQFDHRISILQRESAGLALVIARKLAGEALSRAPLAELEAFLVDCFHKLHREARLVVTVPAENADGLRARLGELVESSGFAGRVIIMADAGMRISDCRVEWADGGIEKNLDDVFAAMEEQLHRWALSTKAEG